MIPKWLLTPTEQTGAAKRLHALLISFQKLNPPADSNNRLFDVLPRVMKVEKDDPNRNAMACISLLNDMFAAVEREVDETFTDQGSRNLHKRPLKGLGAAFSPLNLGTPWAHLKTALKAEDLIGLEYTVQAVELIKVERTITEAELVDLVHGLTDVEALIVDSTLPIEVKRLLLEALARIKVAMWEYSLTGTEGIKEALFSFTGTVAFYKEPIVGVQDSSLKEAIWSVITKVSDVVTLSQAAWVGYHALLPVMHVVTQLN